MASICQHVLEDDRVESSRNLPVSGGHTFQNEESDGHTFHGLDHVPLRESRREYTITRKRFFLHPFLHGLLLRGGNHPSKCG